MDTLELAGTLVDGEILAAGWFRANRAGPAGRRLLVLTPNEIVFLRPWLTLVGRGEQGRWRRDRIVSRPVPDLSRGSFDVALELLDAESRRPLVTLSPLDDSAAGLVARLWGMAEPRTPRRLEVSR